jgi:hypothetical protein
LLGLLEAAESGSPDDIMRATRALEVAFLYQGQINLTA